VCLDVGILGRMRQQWIHAMHVFQYAYATRSELRT
jgi:hypothetical protein